MFNSVDVQYRFSSSVSVQYRCLLLRLCTVGTGGVCQRYTKWRWGCTSIYVFEVLIPANWNHVLRAVCLAVDECSYDHTGRDCRTSRQFVTFIVFPYRPNGWAVESYSSQLPHQPARCWSKPSACAISLGHRYVRLTVGLLLAWLLLSAYSCVIYVTEAATTTNPGPTCITG